MGQRSLKVIEYNTIRQITYESLLAFHSIISEIKRRFSYATCIVWGHDYWSWYNRRTWHRQTQRASRADSGTTATAVYLGCSGAAKTMSDVW